MNIPFSKIPEKISLLNETILISMTEKSDKKIIKNFTETSIKILEADFGWAWWKFKDKKDFNLAYESPTTPFTPPIPRDKNGNYVAINTKKPFFDVDVKKENYHFFDMSRYMKSYIIIPIFYKKNMYGTLVICYKKRHFFTPEELALSQAIGNTIAQSITIHRSVQTDILLAQEKLKTDFIANATHELRTPLAIMRGNVDLALRGKNGKCRSMKNSLRKVSNEINHLSDILIDLETIITKNTKSSKVIYESLELSILIKNISKRLQALSHRKNISIELKKNTSTFLVLGNKNYLNKIFLNIIKNAVSYGKNNGKIYIKIYKEKNMAKVEISDNGIGITKEDLPNIFERFYRTEAARNYDASRSHAGLGLSMVRSLVKNHKGTVEVHSIFGKGSTFTVALPIYKKQQN